MKRARRLVWWMVVLSLVFPILIGGCGREDGEGDTLKIGVVLELTGASAIHGKDCLVGMEIARDKINATGGIKGRTLAFVVEDNASKPGNTVEAMKKLIDVDKVAVIVGPITSAATLAGAEIADRERTVLFSPTAASPKIHGKSAYCFRIGLMTTPQGKRMAEYCYDELGITEMAILAMNDETGTAYANAFQEAYEALGGAVSMRLEYQKTDTEFRTALTQLKGAGASAIYVTCVPTTMAYIARQATELAYSPRFFANAGVEGEDLLTKAGRAADGIVFTGLAPDDAFLSEFQSRAERQPGISGPQGYDAAMIIASALREKGPDKEAIREYLAAMPEYEGVGGKIGFDETGEVVRVPHLKVVRDGEFRKLSD